MLVCARLFRSAPLRISTAILRARKWGSARRGGAESTSWYLGLVFCSDRCVKLVDTSLVVRVAWDRCRPFHIGSLQIGQNRFRSQRFTTDAMRTSHAMQPRQSIIIIRPTRQEGVSGYVLLVMCNVVGMFEVVCL